MGSWRQVERRPREAEEEEEEEAKSGEEEEAKNQRPAVDATPPSWLVVVIHGLNLILC